MREVKVMSQSLEPPIEPRLDHFFEEFGEELEMCNPNAHDLLIKVLEADDKQELLDDFVWQYADELDACQPDAFDMLASIVEEYGIEMW